MHGIRPRRIEHALAALQVEEPTSVEAALRSDQAAEWQDALNSEVGSLKQNGVLEPAELPPGRQAIASKVVFKVKHDAEGRIVKYKARIVAKGFSQVPGVDYDDTFAPVVKYTSLRAILAIAAAKRLAVHQMDVKTAFLQGDLEEEIYVRLPDGVDMGVPGATGIWRVRKALYGLKQAPRAWNAKLHARLLELGYTRCESDHCVYVRAQGPATILAVYVDDIVIVCDEVDISISKQQLADSFDMVDLGKAGWLLGVEIARDGNTITLSQRRYISDMLERFEMADCKPVATPLDHNVQLTVEMCPATEDEQAAMASVPYRSAVGSLMYAMCMTRPDIAVAVTTVSRYMSNPGSAHWTAVKRIFRYLRGTVDYVLRLSGDDLTLSGYCDADFAGNIDTRRSTAGFVFQLGSSPIAWSSRLMSTVALSTAEAEYMTVSNAAREALWLRALLRELGCEQSSATLLRSDNQSSIALVRNPVQHARTKHIDVQYHFARELAAAGVLHVEYCPTDQMVADIFTKALPTPKHRWCVTALGLER
jgi:hypothetical protein